MELLAPLERVEALAQVPPAAGGASTLATAAGLAEPLRKLFAATPQARAAKFTARHFSTASPGGRCEVCEGRGVLTVAMDLLPDVTVGCEACQGLRFQPAVLECRVEGRSIGEVLETPVAVAARLFPRLSVLGALEEVGLGYVKLGQEVRTLSQGERQRLRLAGLLASRDPGRGLAAVLLDEPARGLGPGEVANLVTALHRLAGQGHLVVAVEHDLDLIRAADWVLDLGPGGGPQGGSPLAWGPPEALVHCPESLTGQALLERMAGGCYI